MGNLKIHKGDNVIVIAGKDRHKTGTVEKVLVKENRVVVGGINIVKKHVKKTAQNPHGGIIDKVVSIHASNVMVLDPKDNKPTRIGSKITGTDKVRIAKRSGEAMKRGAK